MKAILLFSVVVLTSFNAICQCDKKVTWYATKGEMLDATGALLDTKLDSIFLETGPEKITLRAKSDANELEGTVKEKTCDWKEPFKKGKSIYHASVSVNGGISDAVFTLEGKDGKIVLSVEIEAMKGRKYVIYIDKYEEGK